MAVDAITKLKKLDVMGEYQLPDDYKASIHVRSESGREDFEVH